VQLNRANQWQIVQNAQNKIDALAMDKLDMGMGTRGVNGSIYQAPHLAMRVNLGLQVLVKATLASVSSI